LTVDFRTPLGIAMIYDKPECVKILFKYGGISLSYCDKTSKTPY
jgi:hypothetical protein